MLRASAISFVLALGLSACGGKGEETAPPKDEGSEPAAAAKGDDEGRKSWRWKGKREDCFFKVDNHCFASMAAACKSADCGDAECVKDGAAPANVSCKED